MTTEEKHYRNIHMWISNNYGRADHCQSPDCTKESTMFHWALKKGCDYTKNVNNFMQLCAKCHCLYDGRAEKLKNNKHTLNKFPSSETRAKMSKSRKGRISGMAGKKHSEETKQRMGVARRGSQNAFYGKTHSQETIDKIKESLKKYYENT